MQNILIYGGSFDPPHFGHLNTAINVQHYFHFDQVVFLPCKTPVLKKTTQASAIERVEMLKILLKDHSEFTISTKEIDRKTPSYMSETLKNFRDELGSTISITLLLGMDAYQSLPQWFEAEKIPALSNLLIIYRQNTQKTLLNSLFTRVSSNPLDLLNSPHGLMAFFDAGNFAISSTQIRENIHSKNTIIDELPLEIAKYIHQHKLYKAR